MSVDIKKIRSAIVKNRGGWENADDAGILSVWASLDAETQKKYMDSVDAKENKK